MQNERTVSKLYAKECKLNIPIPLYISQIECIEQSTSDLVACRVKGCKTVETCARCLCLNTTAACRKPEKKNGTTASDPPPDPASLPDDAIQSMLQREVLLTEAKLHALDWELLQSDRNLRQFRSQLRQVNKAAPSSHLASNYGGPAKHHLPNFYHKGSPAKYQIYNHHQATEASYTTLIQGICLPQVCSLESQTLLSNWWDCRASRSLSA